MTDVQMPLTAHLEELRWRLIKSLAAVALSFVATYNLADPLFVFLTAPLQAQNPGQLIGTGVTEAFFTKMKVAFIASIFVASPVLFYQAWKFVAPGLYDREKRYVQPFVFFATVFFVAGAAFCYWVVFPVGYRFFIDQFESIGVSPQIRISEYLTFSARMLLAFGATFEMPVITFFLARMGLVTHKRLLGAGRYAVLIIFIVAGVLTPGPDVASQLLMAGPLLVLYGVSIGVAYMFSTAGAPGAEEQGAADDGAA